MKRYITIASGKRIGLKQYVNAIKFAKENPKAIFNEGLTGWWEATGDEILKQFMDGVNDRINSGQSYFTRGI